MFIIIEIDKDWRIGIDWFENVKGVCLGFVGIHVVKQKFSTFAKAIKEIGVRE